MKSKIKTTKVQREFNAMICRHWGSCMVADENPCSGGLQCSHFFPVGGNGGLRYYPYNAFAQCAGHHLSHHQRNPMFYTEWMQRNFPEELEWMSSVRGRVIRYTQLDLAKILELCVNDKFYELREYIRGMFNVAR